MPPQLDELLARVDQCSTQAIELSTHFQELREQIRQAIDIAQRDPEMSLIRARKVLEYIVVDIYDDALKPKRAGTQPLEGLVQALVKEGQFPNRLAAYADMVRGLGNVGAHGREKGVSSQDVLNSLSNLLPIVEWFFEHRKSPDSVVAPLSATLPNGPAPVSPSSTQSSAVPAAKQPDLAAPAAPAVNPQTVAAHPQGSAQPRPVPPPLPPLGQRSSAGARPNAEQPGATRRAAPVLQPSLGPDPFAAEPSVAPIGRGRNPSPPMRPATTPVRVAQPVADSRRARARDWATVAAAVALLACAFWYFAHRGGAPEMITNSIGMKLTLIPDGQFMMGRPQNEHGKLADQRPPHSVKITKPFYLGTYSVTRGQFSKFVAATGYKTDAQTDGKGGFSFLGSTMITGALFAQVAAPQELNWRDPGFPQTDEHPVVVVSWNDAMAFCKWLSEKEGKTYRLPTEAEWEYACRAGTTTAYFFGDDPDELDRYAWFADNSGQTTHEVGQKLPNHFGLYDMLGNAWQWCADWYENDYYAGSPPADPQGPDAGSERVNRGGSWNNAPALCRCSSRAYGLPARRDFLIGFRVVREP